MCSEAEAVIRSVVMATKTKQMDTDPGARQPLCIGHLSFPSDCPLLAAQLFLEADLAKKRCGQNFRVNQVAFWLSSRRVLWRNLYLNPTLGTLDRTQNLSLKEEGPVG